MAAFDCIPVGISARWNKWVRRLEESIFDAQKITEPLQKKGLLLCYGGEALHDIWDGLVNDTLQGRDVYEHLKRNLQNISNKLKQGKLAEFFICASWL